MKKIVLLFTIAVVAFSCKKESNNTNAVEAEKSPKKPVKNVTIGDPFYRGDFLAAEGTAILTMGNTTYKVVDNELSKELAEKSKAYKKEDFDFVKVVVKGKVAANPNANEWAQTLTITSIEEIAKSDSVDNITIVK